MSKLTHLDDDGAAQMVDVSAKESTRRVAVARGCVYMSTETLELVWSGGLAKGEALSVARIAGIMAAKRTPDLIPLCHSLKLDQVTVEFTRFEDESALGIEACARCFGPTGVEMEAMAAVSTAALTIYDMAKGVDRSMRVEHVHLWHKSGGRSQDFHHPDPPGPWERDP